MLLDLTELSSYLPLVPCFEFGNASGTLFPCTEGRVRTIMVPPGTPRAGAFDHARHNYNSMLSRWRHLFFHTCGLPRRLELSIKMLGAIVIGPAMDMPNPQNTSPGIYTDLGN